MTQQTVRAAIARLLASVAVLLALCSTGSAQTQGGRGDFDQARILRADGEYQAAIDILRRLLRTRPDDTALREELGYALILDRQMAAAQYQFEILKERSRDPGLRNLYAAVLRRIVDERPVGISVIFGFTPTTNLNQGTDNTTLYNDVLGVGEIAPESRRIAGWHGRIGLRGYVRGNIGTNGQVVFDWRAERHVYSALYEPETETELGLSFSQSTLKSDFGTRVFSTHRRRDRGNYSRSGVTFFGGRETAPGRRINGFLQFSLLDVEADTGEDGMRTLLDVGYALTPTPAFALRFGLQAARVNARRNAQSYSSLAATVQASTAFRGGYELSAQAVAGHRRFDSDLGFTREDNFVDVSVTVFNSRFSVGGVVPKLTCAFTATASNVALFETRSRACGLSLSRRF
ncbi:MAG: surface lipoprotein assembly modifier [Sulfitobacter sp.]